MMTDTRPSSADKEGGLWAAVGLAWELGYIIALPIVILGLGGAYADKAYGTSPGFLLAGILLSLLLSGIGVYRKVKAIERQEPPSSSR